MGDYYYNSYNGDLCRYNNGYDPNSNFQNNNWNFYNDNDLNNNDCYHNEFYDSSPQNPYDNEKNQIHESPFFFDNHERSEEYSYNEQYNQSQGYDNYYDYYSPPPQTNSSDMSLEDIVKNLAISTLSFQQETRATIKNLEQIMQQLSDDPPETTQEDEVTFLSNDEFVEKNVCCHDETFDYSMHEPTSPNSEVVIEDYVSSDEEEIEMEIINQEKNEKNEINLEEPQIIFYEPETPKVVIFFGPTNDPPISDDLVVINTIDDYDCEHNANVLFDTVHKLENYCFSCNRSKMLNNSGAQQRVKNSIPRTRDWLFNKKSKCSHRNIIIQKSRIRKLREDMPFDPGGIQTIHVNI